MQWNKIEAAMPEEDTTDGSEEACMMERVREALEPLVLVLQ